MKMVLSPFVGQRPMDETSKIKVQTSQLTASFKKIMDNVKNKGLKAYPWNGLGPEEMREYVNEIKELKRERLEQLKQMTVDGRDIVQTNAQEVWARTKNFYQNSLRAYVRILDERVIFKIDIVE